MNTYNSTAENICYSSNHSDLPTIIDRLDIHVSEKGNDVSLIFLADGYNEMSPMTFSDLQRESLKFAYGIRKYANKGDRIVLLFQSSYEFAIAFFGCMYAGVISIPLPIPSRRGSEWDRLKHILKNANTNVVVTTDKIYPRLITNAERNSMSAEINIHTYESLLCEKASSLDNIKGNDVAFLQYTSGSTGEPKGVVLTHDNLTENQVILEKGFDNYGDSVYCSWLPLFHDMGLIGNFMQAIYIGQPFIFMAPNAFLQKPIRWLKAISDYNVRVSGAPNFAYDLCVDRITESEKKDIDLSSWDKAFNGAEPVRAKTLKRFSNAFSSCGFKEESFYPCYGTAESTLIISGSCDELDPTYLNVDRELYENDIIKVIDDKSNIPSTQLVASGTPLINDSIAIVDGEDGKRIDERCVGEIWLTSPCNAIGYWDNPDASKKTFFNKLHDTSDQRPYLNTGDLGFIDNGKLYITGRSKDLLIFNGRNIYPQDIEACSELSHPALKSGRCAAVSQYIDGKERLILVHEIERTFLNKVAYEDVGEQIRMAVYKEFTIPIYSVAFVFPSTVPMTSSGKIRRQASLEQYKNGDLKLLHCWSIAKELDNVKNSI